MHKNTVVACVMITPAHGRMKKSVRTFGATTADILALRDWVDAQQVTHLALESTGIFWRPLYNLLEDGHTVILVNPHQKKQPYQDLGPTYLYALNGERTKKQTVKRLEALGSSPQWR